MRRFHRQEVIIYRWQANDSFRIHTQRGQLESLWDLLAGLVAD
jgi:sarcosine oxidase gamma subunit